MGLGAKEQGKRIEIIDAFRGIAILGMVFQHTLVDLKYIFGQTIALLDNQILVNIFSFGGIFFIFLSGISTQFSKRNARRGLELISLGILITVVTVLFLPTEAIYFGILHFLGVSILIYAVLRPFLQKANQMAVFLVGLGFFIISYVIYNQDIRLEFILSFLIGFPSRDFWSADYFPIFPYFFAFISGTGFGWFVVNRKLPATFYEIKFPAIAVVGRYSLWVYLFHQPIIVFILQFFFKNAN